MDRKIESELFDRLFRERRLQEWLREQLDAQMKVLVVNPDMEQIRKAQGSAQFITAMLDKLSAAESAAKR